MGTHPIFESDFDCLTESESLDISILATFRQIQKEDEDAVDMGFYATLRKLAEPGTNSLIAQFYMVAASRCDECIGFVDFLREKVSDVLDIVQRDWSPYLHPYVMMLFNQLVVLPDEPDYDEYSQLSDHLAHVIIENGELTRKTIGEQFERFKENMYCYRSDELELYSEVRVVSCLLGLFNAVVILKQPGQLVKFLSFLFDEEEEDELSEHGKLFLTDVLMTDDGLMIDVMNLLMAIDANNLSQLDFVQVFALYLERVNFDDELFVGLLLECEGAKFLYFLLKLYKTDNVVQRFDNWTSERGRFRVWTFKLMH